MNVNVKAWIAQYKFYVIAAGAILVLGTLYYFYIYQPGTTKDQGIAEIETSTPSKVQNNTEPDKSKKEPAIKGIKEDIIVDVKGEIKLPGVYHSNQNERVMDVINRAGGLTDNADKTQVNFAAHVQDEMVIYIPAKGEVTTGTVNSPVSTGPSNGGAGTQGGKININKAAQNELQNLPGIGPAKAAAIIQYRKENGLFQTIEDLKKISGIGDKTFDKLKESISVQ